MSMKKINDKECVCHKVTITSHFEGLIYIPIEMDATDLKSLTMQSNHIFKMAQTFSPEEFKTDEVVKIDTNIKTDNNILEPIKTRKIRAKYIRSKALRWTDKLNNELISLNLKGLTVNQISKKMNLKYLQIYWKLKRMNANINTEKSPRKKSMKRRKRIDILEKRKRVNEYKKCKNFAERKKFAAKYNIDLSKFQKKISKWKNQIKNKL